VKDLFKTERKKKEGLWKKHRHLRGGKKGRIGGPKVFLPETGSIGGRPRGKGRRTARVGKIEEKQRVRREKSWDKKSRREVRLKKEGG